MNADLIDWDGSLQSPIPFLISINPNLPKTITRKEQKRGRSYICLTLRNRNGLNSKVQLIPDKLIKRD